MHKRTNTTLSPSLQRKLEPLLTLALPVPESATTTAKWIPAFAGMTSTGVNA